MKLKVNPLRYLRPTLLNVAGTRRALPGRRPARRLAPIAAGVNLKNILVPIRSLGRRWRTTSQLMNDLLVPTDFSAESRTALQYAKALARTFGASITLL